MIEFKNYHNAVLNRILFLTEHGKIIWKKKPCLNGKRYRGYYCNHIFTVKVFNLDKNNHIGYIPKAITDIYQKWVFIKENQIIIDCFIEKLIDLIDTKDNYYQAEKIFKSFVDITTGEILLDNNEVLARKFFDDLLIKKTYSALNKFYQSQKKIE